MGCVETCALRGRRSAVTRAAVGTEDGGIPLSDRCFAQQIHGARGHLQDSLRATQLS